jgi:hypothetical protein
MLNNKQIGNFLRGIKTQYKNLFNEKLKKPKELHWEFYHNTGIDSLSFTLRDWERNIHKIITIIQYYNQKTKELSYTINFDLPNEWDQIGLSSDSGKELEFIEQRNNYIRKFSTGHFIGMNSTTGKKSNVTKNELFEIIFVKFLGALNDEVYRKWKEDYELRKDSNKYNL